MMNIHTPYIQNVRTVLRSSLQEAINNNDEKRLNALWAKASPYDVLESLRLAAKHGCVEAVEMLVGQVINCNDCNAQKWREEAWGKASKAAVVNAHPACLHILLPWLNIYQKREMLLLSIEQGDAAAFVQCAKILLSAPDLQKDRDPFPLRMAARNGCHNMVLLLLPYCDPKEDNSAALAEAAANGHLTIVHTLIPVSDPKAAESDALWGASYYGHHACVDALYGVSNPKVVLRNLKEDNPDEPIRPESYTYLQELINAEKQKKSLLRNLHGRHKPKNRASPRKM